MGGRFQIGIPGRIDRNPHRLAHTLKGVAGSLAADEAFRAARILETTLQNDSTSDVRVMAETLADCIKSALIAAERICK